MGVSLFGDWEKAHNIVETMQARFERASTQCVLKEAHLLRSHIVTGIREQAPGGEPFAPLSELTLAIRQFLGFKGTKALIRRGDLRNAIVVKQFPSAKAVFVGILRTAKAKDGKSVINVAELMENGGGPFIIPITPKSQALFHIALRRAGISAVPQHNGGGGGARIAIYKIRARPFMAPVFKKFGKPDDVRKRFFENLSKAMMGDFGG